VERGAAQPRERRSRGDTGARVLAALPLIAFAIFIVAEGGLIFTLGVVGLGVVMLQELYGMMERARPINLAGWLALAGMSFAALYGDKADILLAFVLAIPVTFVLALVRPMRRNVSWGVAATLLGVSWIAIAIVHAILLRELDHGGALVVDALIGTFVGDTAAYFGGRAWGRRPLAPVISPQKTLEGLLSGIAGGTFAFWLFAFAYQDWISGTDALVIGFCVALAAPLGDLFESMLKRDLEVKDTSRAFGPHGGVLDRLDAALFALPTAYYVSLAVL
jgi:phosphatidate cytidylyltransferase